MGRYRFSEPLMRAAARTPCVVRYADPGICPHCGSRELTTLPESDAFYSRTGCCACNRWFTEDREKA